MKRKNLTRNALVSSIISLLLCVSMLVGTTFAWFTDEVTISNNKIAAGTLQIALNQLTKDGWTDITGSQEPIFNNDLWEPGYTEAVVLKVHNIGTLALNWAASLTPISADTVTELADAIDVYVLEGADRLPDSFAYIQGNYNRVGTLREFMTSFAANTVGTLDADEAATLGIALHMQEEAGNKYQGLALGSNFDIRIFATQRSLESDSFGPDYDSGSKYPANYEVATTAPVTVVKDADNKITAATLNNPQTINLGKQDNSVVNAASVVVPEGAAVEPEVVTEEDDGKTNASLTVSIKEEKTAPEGITISDDQEVLPLKIEVKGLADSNTAVLTVKANIGAGRNNVKLYHHATEMQALSAHVDNPTAADDNHFYYDRVTGDLYIYASSFSPFTIVNDADHVAVIGSTYYATLAEALEAAQNGDVINLLKNVKGDVTVTQKPDVNFTINGNDKTFNGVLTVDGKSARYETAGLTIKNVNFNAEGISADACIRLGYVDAARYTNNVTVSNCTFNGTGNEKVAVKSYTGGDYNLTIDGCTVNNGMHSLAQLKNVEKNLIVKNCKVYSKNGLNINNGTNLTMDGCTFDVQGYAVRFGESDNTAVETFTINNSTLKSACAKDDDAVVVFRAGAVNATLNLNNTKLVGTPAIKGATADTTVLVDGFVEVHTADELVAALEKKLNTRLMNDIKVDPANMSNAYGKTGINVYEGQILDGNGFTLDVQGAGGTWDSGICTRGGCVIKNIKVTGSFRGIFVRGGEGKVVLKNVTTEKTTYTISIDQASYQGLEATDCSFNGWTSFAASIGEVKFENCSFGPGSGYNYSRPYATTSYIGCSFAEGHQMDAVGAVTFEDCTFNGEALTADNLATLVTGNTGNASVK